jgi:hypothetical protein
MKLLFGMGDQEEGNAMIRAIEYMVAVGVSCLLSRSVLAAVTIDCVPIGGTQLTGNQTVVVECFITSPVTELIEAGRWDFACSPPGVGNASGNMESVSLYIEYNHQPEPYLFLGGAAGTQQGPCLAFGLAQFEAEYVTLPAGETRYLSTIEYQASDCAAGEFEVILEGIGNPPQVTDSTRFVQLGYFGDPEHLIPINYTPTVLNVVTGACCDGSTCMADGLNASCCQSKDPGAHLLVGRACLDADPCHCLSDSECDDLVFCNGQERCDFAAGECGSGPPACPAAPPYPGLGFECDETGKQCVGQPCLFDQHCDDLNPCNGDETCQESTFLDLCILGTPMDCDDLDPCNGREECDPASAQCVPGTAPCDDGVFCNGLEICDAEAGCLAPAPPCAAGFECDEERDECFFPGIPTVSAWGLGIFALLVGIGAKVRFSRTLHV